MADLLSLLNDVSWSDEVELPNDVAAPALDVNTANDALVTDAVPVNNANPVNDVSVNPDVRVNPVDVNDGAAANVVQDADVPANSEGGNATRARPGKFSYAGVLARNIPQEVLDSADEDERAMHNRTLNMSTFEHDNFHPLILHQIIPAPLFSMFLKILPQPRKSSMALSAMVFLQMRFAVWNAFRITVLWLPFHLRNIEIDS